MYTITNSPIGYLLLVASSKGICSLRLGDSREALIKEYSKEYKQVKLEASSEDLQKWAQAVVDYLSADKPWPVLPYDVQATPFQHRVWKYMRKIPAGRTYHYEQLAKAIGKPKAVRAVASACAANPVALVIPCHRIVPKAGGVGGYRWNPSRKQKLLQLEKA